MIKSVSLKHFRAFRELKLEPLKRVNLIIGQNNTGKTAVLEALAWVLMKSPAACAQLPGLFRPIGGDPNINFWNWLFHNKSGANPIELAAQFEGFPDFALRVKKNAGQPANDSGFSFASNVGGAQLYTPKGRTSSGLNAHVFSTFPSNPRQDAIDFNRVVLRRRKKQVEALLQKIEPRLQGIESLQTGTEPLLYADIGLSELIPVTQLGQGFNRLLDIYSEVVAAEAKVLLIDEIENGLHHSVLKTVWSGLFTAATEMDVQIFATTHSWECVLAADEAASKQPSYDLNLIRLDRVDDEIKATIIDQQALETAKQLNWEMR